MSHLPAERLAALADDLPLHATPRDAAPAGTATPPPLTAEEEAHLAACAACAGELSAHRALLALAADERSRLAPPLTAWGSIAAQLRAEGMLGGAYDDSESVPALAFALTGSSSSRRRPSVATTWGRRAAAAALFIVGGVMAGRMSAGLSPLGPTGSVAVRDSVRVANAVAAGIEGGVVAASNAGASLVADTMTAFHSTTEALVALARAEREYQVAAAYLLAHDSSANAESGGSRGARGGDSSGIYRARLAALDNVMAASREALYEAPHDPVINRYYLATVGAREATLQQLNTALPAGAKLTRF